MKHLQTFFENIWNKYCPFLISARYYKWFKYWSTLEINKKYNQKRFLFRKLRYYYGKVIFSESLRSQKGQNKPKKHPKIQFITYIWKKNSQWLCARSIIMMHFLPKTHKLSLELRILESISKMSMKSSLKVS